MLPTGNRLAQDILESKLRTFLASYRPQGYVRSPSDITVLKIDISHVWERTCQNNTLPISRAIGDRVLERLTATRVAEIYSKLRREIVGEIRTIQGLQPVDYLLEILELMIDLEVL
jgi:hypothetical protein